MPFDQTSSIATHSSVSMTRSRTAKTSCLFVPVAPIEVPVLFSPPFLYRSRSLPAPPIHPPPSLLTDCIGEADTAPFIAYIEANAPLLSEPQIRAHHEKHAPKPAGDEQAQVPYHCAWLSQPLRKKNQLRDFFVLVPTKNRINQCVTQEK